MIDKESRKLIKKLEKKYEVSPKKLERQLQRIMESGLFELKPHRSGDLIVIKRKR